MKQSYRKYMLFFGIFIAYFFSSLSFPVADEKSLDAALKQLKSSGKYFSRGLNEFDQGNLDKSAAAFQKCLNELPQHAYASYNLANLAYLHQDYSKSLELMEQALSNLDFMWEINAYAVEKKVENIDDLRSVLEELWDSTNSCRDSREIEMTQDYLDKKESDLELETQKKNKMQEHLKAHYLYFHGNILFQLRRIPEAFREYQEAVKLNPLHAGAYNNIIAILYVAKEYQKAISVMEEAEQQGLNEQLNLKLIEMLYQALGRPTEGIMQEKFLSQIDDQHEVLRLALPYRQEQSLQPPLYENGYVVIDKHTKAAILIDPGVQDSRVQEFIQQQELKVQAVLITHGHADHTGAADYYANLYSVPICAHQDDLDRFPIAPDRILSDRDILEYGGLKIKVIHTPGHTNGSVCFLIDDFLFSGDTLFRNDIGRVWADDEKTEEDLRKKLLKNIKDQLLILSGRTKVFPGHGKTTTIADEKTNNPLLK